VLRMAVGHSDDVDAGDAIAAAIEECRAGLDGLTPQSAILIVSYESFDPAMLAAVNDAFPGMAVVGATSAAEMSSVGGFKEDSVSLTAFASDEVDVTVGFARGLGEDVEGAARGAALAAMAGTTLEPKACIVLAENFVTDPQKTINAVAGALPDGVVIVGGGSGRGRSSEMRPTLQFGGGEVADDGLAVVLFSGPLAISTAVGTGWKTIGRRGTVTASSQNLVEGINGRPAAEFVSRYVGDLGAGIAGTPFAIFESSGEDFYLRTMMPWSGDDRGLTVMGTIPEGHEVQLTTASTDEILAGARSSVTRALEDFPAGATPEAALVFSCAVRKALLGSRTRIESELVRSVLGETIPVAGLYCYGEIGPIGDSGSRVLNETFVTLLLGT
jgi:hypothetical protein